MAFPYVFDENFEDGTKGAFDVETDTETRLDIVHYSTLAGIPRAGAPFRGAYCVRVALENDGSPADAYLQETDAFDFLTADATTFIRFHFRVSENITMANADEFALFQLWSSTNTVEAGVYVNFTTANGLRIGIGETTALQLKGLTTGVWHCIEMTVNIDNAGSDDGTIDGWFDGAAFTQITARDQGVITSGVLGVLSQDVGTTAGTVLIDQVIVDNTRIGFFAQRYPHEVVLTRSGHVCLGPGELAAVTLLSGNGTDCALNLYDTDIANTLDQSNFIAELRNTALLQTVPLGSDNKVRFDRGCYVQLSGTDPRALLKISRCQGYYDEGLVRVYGYHRKAHPLGA